MCSAGAHGWTQASGVTKWSLKIIVLGLNSNQTTLVISCSLLVTECHAQPCKPPFVLKVLVCKCVWIASFTIQLTQLLLYSVIIDLITPLICMQPQVVLCRCVYWAGWMVSHIKIMIMGIVLSSETVVNLNHLSQLAVWEYSAEFILSNSFKK
jgi:hypothetical protein